MLELSLRDGMVLLGSLLILAVIVDAVRRLRYQKRDRVRLKLNKEAAKGTDGAHDSELVEDLTMFRELPNGGARIVSRDDLLGRRGDERSGNTVKDDLPAAARSPVKEASEKVSEAQQNEHQGEGLVSQLDDPVDERVDVVPGGSADDGLDDGSDDSVDGWVDSTADAQDTAMSGMRASNDEPTNLDWLEDLTEDDDGDDPEAGELPRDAETDVIILHVLARNEQGFSGKQILELLLACDLRFGDMSFFHRHEHQAGRGPIQFSVANMLQPGVFDIDNMNSMHTRGLVFFLTLPGPDDMSQAFDYMLETARAVARNLGGDLLDESRSVLTQQAVEHYRQQIRELERRLLTKGG